MTIPSILSGKMALPVMASPLFLISGPELVIAQCKAGVIGSFPALNARPAEALDGWLDQISNELQQFAQVHPDRRVSPFAVNQICHPTNDRLRADMKLCVKHRVPIIITSLQLPEWLVEEAHAYGALVFHDVTNIKHAKRAAKLGVDGLILVCAGAGGHAGALSPFALVREVRQWFDKTVLMSGAISDGYGIAAAQMMGADLAYVGTRFIATEEANASDGYKGMLVDHDAADIVYTNLITGVHGNYLAPSLIAAGLDPENLPVSDKSKMNFGSGGNTKAKAWKDIWGAGQGLGTITDAPRVDDLVTRMREEYSLAVTRFGNLNGGDVFVPPADQSMKVERAGQKSLSRYLTRRTNNMR